MPEPDELIGSAEAAQILHVDRRTLGRWSEQGRIQPVQRLRGRNGPKLYARSDVEHLARELANHTRRPA